MIQHKTNLNAVQKLDFNQLVLTENDAKWLKKKLIKPPKDTMNRKTRILDEIEP